MPTRTRTVLFTDIANYTVSVGRSNREDLRHLIATHEQTVAPVLRSHNGQVVKNLGDSFMGLFSSATDAVRAALDLVEAFHDGTQGFTLRVDMATGDVEEIEGDAFGDAVNLASRILRKTPNGEVWLSLGTQVCMNQAEVAWEPVGRFELKGIAGETQVYRAVPHHQTSLPEPVTVAARAGRLVQIELGDPLPPLPPQPIILLKGCEPGSNALNAIVDRLPVVDPASLWLVTYTVPSGDRVAWQSGGRGLVIGTTAAVDRALAEARRVVSHTSSSETIIIDVSATAVMELVMSGLALPAAPLSGVVAGYTYDLLGDGRWVNRSDGAIARLDVAPGVVSLHARSPGVLVNSRQVQPGSEVVLEDGDEIRVPTGPIRYVALDTGQYVGLLVAEMPVRLGIAPGQVAEFGREPNHPGLALPDRRGQDNIRWCVGSRAARARESGFTMDKALVGRRQGAVSLGPGGATVLSLHDRCPTYVVRGNDLIQIRAPSPVGSGDLVIAGTSVLAVREPS